MKTAEEWLAECPEEMSGDLMQQIVGRETFTKTPTVQWIQQIQHDAYEQGRKDAMEWVSKECKRLTENLVNPDRPRLHDYMLAYPAKFIE